MFKLTEAEIIFLKSLKNRCSGLSGCNMCRFNVNNKCYLAVLPLNLKIEEIIEINKE